MVILIVPERQHKNIFLVWNHFSIVSQKENKREKWKDIPVFSLSYPKGKHQPSDNLLIFLIMSNSENTMWK